MASINNQRSHVEVMELTARSQQQRQEYEDMVHDLRAREVAATIDVPTLPEQVRAELRNLGLPVRLFGENLANVRDRLRMSLARRQVTTGHEAPTVKQEPIQQQKQDDEEEVTKYTRATLVLIEARQAIAKFSLEKAHHRLERERYLRSLALAEAKNRKRKATIKHNSMDGAGTQSNDDFHDDQKKPAAPEKNNDLSLINQACLKLYKKLHKMGLDGSQYGDTRVLSCIGTAQVGGVSVIATASWTGSIHLWNGGGSNNEKMLLLQSLGSKHVCHEDRIMGMHMKASDSGDNAFLTTASIDMTAKLWSITQSDVVMDSEADGTHVDDNTGTLEHETPSTSLYNITEKVCFKGHAARLSRVAIHPMMRHVGTTSFDHTWRLWDMETSQNILLQDGHWKECYGIGFHPDGSLCATTDFAGVVQVWDLRTGKSIHHCEGHARRVLNAEFHPINGFQLATAGDDGTIKIWDLRRRKVTASIPAHFNLISRLEFDPANGEFLASCSFDGTAKLWSCRDWNILTQLQGHEGKVAGLAILASKSRSNCSIATCGFDKTLKLWR